MSRFKVKDNNDQWVDISASGVGVPSGGTQGQVLTKHSGTNYDTAWVTPTSVYVGASEPLDANIQVWLDTDEQGASSVTSVNGKNGTVVLDADDVGAMSEWDLLWTNASPSSNFSAQEIALDTTFDLYAIRYLGSNGDNSNEIIFLQNVLTKYCNMQFISGTENNFSGIQVIFKRSATRSSNGITFSNGYMSQQGGSWTTNYSANKCIPMQIYGIKGVQAS